MPNINFLGKRAGKDKNTRIWSDNKVKNNFRLKHKKETESD